MSLAQKSLVFLEVAETSVIWLFFPVHNYSNAFECPGNVRGRRLAYVGMADPRFATHLRVRSCTTSSYVWPLLSPTVQLFILHAA